MAESYNPNLMTYLGLGLLRSSLKGPRQNLGTNLLDSLGQYGQAKSAYGQDQRQQATADRQQKLLDAQLADEDRRQQAMGRIGGLLSQEPGQFGPEQPGAADRRMREAQIEYGMNVDPKSLGGILNMDPGAPESFGVSGIPGFFGEEPGIIQLGSRGTARRPALPEGFRMGMPQTTKDAGGELVNFPRFAGGPVDAPRQKTLQPSETVPYKAAAAAATAEGSEFGKQRAAVEGDVGGLDAIRSARGLLDDGIYTGFYANAAKTIAKATPGMDKSKVARTEEFLSHVGNVVIPRLKEFGGSDTVEEMNYLRKIMAGEITMEKEALQKILRSAEAKVQRRIERLGGGAASPGSRPPIGSFFK